MDLAEDLERAIGDGPQHQPLSDRLVAGRRAVRRQRLARTAGTVSVLVACVGLVGLLRDPKPARSDPGYTVVAPATQPAGRRGLLRGCGAAVDPATNRVYLAQGVRVVHRVPGVTRASVAPHSLALDVIRPDGSERWVHFAWTDESMGAGCDDPTLPEALPSFEAFVKRALDGNGVRLP